MLVDTIDNVLGRNFGFMHKFNLNQFDRTNDDRQVSSCTSRVQQFSNRFYGYVLAEKTSGDLAEKPARFTTQVSSDDQQPLNRQASVTPSTVTQYSCRRPSLRHPASAITQFSVDSANSETKLLAGVDAHDTPSRRGQPSAPPVEELDELPDTVFVSFNNAGADSRYSRLSSQLSTASAPSYPAFPQPAAASRDYTRSESGSALSGQTAVGLAPCPSCSSMMPSCPPPCYDDHHKDRVCN